MNIKICLLICTSVMLVQYCTGRIRENGDQDLEYLGKTRNNRGKGTESGIKTNGIVHGRLAKMGTRPYHVALSTSRHGKFCGGTIISPRYILTAAHCFVKVKSPGQLKVVVGALNAKHPGVPYKSSKIIIHENYDPIKLMNDIALVQVEKPISFNQDASAAKLPDSTTKINDGDTVTVVGFGKTVASARADHLQEADLTVFNQEACKKKFATVRATILDSNICIMYKMENGKRTDSCYGDSGGGGILKGTIISVVSYGAKGETCRMYDFPTVHTRVSEYLDWIKENTK